MKEDSPPRRRLKSPVNIVTCCTFFLWCRTRPVYCARSFAPHPTHPLLLYVAIPQVTEEVVREDVNVSQRHNESQSPRREMFNVAESHRRNSYIVLSYVKREAEIIQSA